MQMWEGRIVSICSTEKDVVIQLKDGLLLDVRASSYLAKRLLKLGDTVKGSGDVITHLNRIIYK